MTNKSNSNGLINFENFNKILKEFKLTKDLDSLKIQSLYNQYKE